jgi:hypothetical protein
VKLISIIMADGSRDFGGLPQTYGWTALRLHLLLLPGVVETGFITDGITEGWLDFDYQGHHFSLNDQNGDYWFFVDDPACPDAILTAVLEHCAALLGDS